MVQVHYHTKKGTTSVASTDEWLSFFLTNADGSYFFSPIVLSDISHYCGFFIPYPTPDGWKLCKTLHSFRLNEKITNVDNNLTSTFLTYENGAEVEYFLHHTNVLSCTVKNFTGEIPLELDCRSMYDFSSDGRGYSIHQNDEFIVIAYEKEDATFDNGLPYKIYAVIWTDMEPVEVKQWIEKQYPLEQKRGSQPTSSWMYQSHSMQVNKTGSILFAVGFDENQTIASLRSVLENTDYLKKTALQYTSSITSVSVQIPDKKIETAYMCSIKSVMDLVVERDKKGLYAGLPWFFQFWTRDEAIGIGALLTQQRFELVKELLMRQFSQQLSDGRISNRHPHSDLGSADGIGWTCKRMYDLLHTADALELFAVDELVDIRKKIVESVTALEATYGKDHLIENKALETWMDTGDPYDVRDGYRIEIQALHLIQLRLINLLNEFIDDGKFNLYEQKEEATRHEVATTFFQEYLLDGLSIDTTPDPTIRPNVFIAYYVYPWLLNYEGWEKTFDQCIEHLYQPWGGLSTIEKSHPLYCELYQGEKNTSYHRGDVWFFLNGLAAICLHRLNHKKYKDIIEKIVESSAKEILSCGAIGRHAEVSDAKILSSHGCFFQLWSSALFVELIHELGAHLKTK